MVKLMNKLLHVDLKDSIESLITIINEINGQDFDVYTNPRTKILIRNKSLLSSSKPADWHEASSELFSSIIKWYDGGFKRHSIDEQKTQRTAVDRVFYAAARYLLEFGNELEKENAKRFL